MPTHYSGSYFVPLTLEDEMILRRLALKPSHNFEYLIVRSMMDTDREHQEVPEGCSPTEWFSDYGTGRVVEAVTRSIIHECGGSALPI